MSRTTMASSWTSGRRWRIAGLAIACLAASTAAADSASLAAPGDCAQPSRDLDPGPVLPAVSSAAVAGSPVSHFVPIAILGNAGSLPADLTRTTVQTVSGVAEQSTSLANDATSVLVDPASPLQIDPGSVLLNNPTAAPVLQPGVSILDGVRK